MSDSNIPNTEDHLMPPSDQNALMPATRQEVAERIYHSMANSSEAQNLNLILQRAYSKGTPPHGISEITVSTDDPKFQNCVIEYGADYVINTALDENLEEAYGSLFLFSGMADQILDSVSESSEGDKDPVEKAHYLRQLSVKLSQCPELWVAQHVCDFQKEISDVLNNEGAELLTTVYVNKIQEKFENISDYLNFEQRATGYYKISILHRALEVEKEKPSLSANAEKNLLKKVLDYSSDYKKINYCVNRIGIDKNFNGMYKAAYKRALHTAQTSQEIYKINSALAQIYLDDYHPQIGYAKDLHEEHKLAKAELHYLDAFEYAPKPEHLHILKEIGKLQKKQNKIQEWTGTQTKLAMEYMQGEDRVLTLIKISKGNPALQKEYLEAAIFETAKSKKISKVKKEALIQDIDSRLRPIYESEHNQIGCQKLDVFLKKYTLKSKAEVNPLLKYQNKAKSK